MRTQKQFITIQKSIKMKQIIKSFSEGRNYEVGDVVYLAYDEGGPTCKSEVLEPDGKRWIFKPIEKQSFYPEEDGIIGFSDKPFICAKETDERRAEK